MDSVCYCDVLRAATRKTTAIYDVALAPAGVNLAQFSLLRKIQRAGSVSLSELGRLAALDRSTIGRNDNRRRSCPPRRPRPAAIFP
jgi:DNA-binding MarR family transcriptional regulator